VNRATTILVLTLAPTLAPAQEQPVGLATGAAHLVTLTASPTEGLEVGIPKESWYARGIALDIRGKWEQSHRAYQKAVSEFQRMIRERPQWKRMIRGWLVKAQFQRDQSHRLKFRNYYTWGPPSASMIYTRAAAKHNKWLAIRAFTGRALRRLQEEVIEDYKKALQQSPHYDSARIALAAMYCEIGQHARGRQEFAKVHGPMRIWLALEEAYFYTVAGDTDQAFKLLAKAIQYNSSNKKHILRSNDFDRLRMDPRFAKLVGTP
jgi:tetratricopeptide (TPR) repeat protein